MADSTALVAGVAEGEFLVLDAPLSLWGGLDPATGRVVDVRHPQHGDSVAGRIVVMPTGRGSSSSSTVLVEAARLGTAPAGIVVAVTDPVLVVGAIVAERLYGISVPIVRTDTLDRFRTGDHGQIRANGRVIVLRRR